MNATLVIAALAVPLIIGLAAYVWLSLALGAVFRKAGEAPWKAWVPVLNQWTLFELGGVRGWWAAVIAGGVTFALIVGASLQAAGGGEPTAAASLIGAVVQALLLLAIIVLALVLLVRALLRIGESFGLSAAWVVLGIVSLPIWASIVGWGSARWLGQAPRKTDAAAPAPPAPPLPPPPPMSAAAAAARPGVPFTPAPSAPVPGAQVPGAQVPGAPAAPAAAPAPASAGWSQAGPASAPASAPAAWQPPAAPRATPAPAPAAAPAAPVASGAERAPAADAWAPRPFEPALIDSVPPARAPIEPRAFEAQQIEPQQFEPQQFDPQQFEPRPPTAPQAFTPAPPSTPAGASTPTPPAGFDLPPAVAAGAASTPENDPLEDRTVLAPRRTPTRWNLLLPDGTQHPLGAGPVVLGRKPTPPGSLGDAQLVPVEDFTRTVSKTHALLTPGDSGWTITDLDSTNGVVVIGEDGTEIEIVEATPVHEKFLLGDAEFSLRSSATTP